MPWCPPHGKKYAAGIRTRGVQESLFNWAPETGSHSVDLEMNMLKQRLRLPPSDVTDNLAHYPWFVWHNNINISLRVYVLDGTRRERTGFQRSEEHDLDGHDGRGQGVCVKSAGWHVR